ncbi:MAG: hypothetical protein BWY06_02841 [Candidatus Latescibacteria bacterium ADurb.Bin168]|nr:MAG: hypothetical protein BWY06_02841 [Candidatus Latescibacteria bacterium ADurb.Bin168]
MFSAGLPCENVIVLPCAVPCPERVFEVVAPVPDTSPLAATRKLNVRPAVTLVLATDTATRFTDPPAVTLWLKPEKVTVLAAVCVNPSCVSPLS